MFSMAGEEDQDIFSAGEAPETAVPETPVDDSQAVRDGIRDMQRGREPSQPTPHGPPTDAQSPSGILKNLLDERDRRQDAERKIQRYEEQQREAAKGARGLRQPEAVSD
jgi:hypothetical protein